MELRVLNYFLMTAREENITKAAKLLHITQPTLSRQLMQLEEELGVTLFERGKHSITLTEDGKLLERRAQEILELAEKTKEEFLQKESSLTGELSVGSGELRSSRFLAQLLASFQKEHPLVRYEIYSGNSDNIKERIEQGTLDLGILVEPVDMSKYEFLRLPEKETWGILVREDSKLAEKEKVTPEDLEDVPLIMTRRAMLQNEIFHWFGSLAEEIEIVAGGNLWYNMVAMVEGGLGVGLSIDLNCKYENVTFIPLSPGMESRTVLAWKKAQAFSPVTKAFIRHARNFGQPLWTLS